MNVVEASACVLTKMATFAEAGVSTANTDSEQSMPKND